MQGNVFGLVYTGESSMQLRDLTYSRSVAAVPFAGRYRCIDFVLSSLVNTGISNVGVIAQKNYHSLMDHLGSGKEWELHRKRDGLFILPPFVTHDNTGIYKGTLDAYRSVLGYIRRSSQRYVILTGSHTVFNTTFHKMIEQHIQTGADITIMYNEVPLEHNDDQFDELRLDVDETGRVQDLQLNPYRPTSFHSACDVFMLEKTLLEYLIEEAVSHGFTDFIRDVLLKKVHTLKIYGWRYDGYIGCLSSIASYFTHNMNILTRQVRDDLFNPDHPIYTKVKDEVPAHYLPGAKTRNSLIADGCVVDGEVDSCVLFRGVKVGKGVKLSNCLVLQGCDIQEGCELDYVILDKGCTVHSGCRLAGYDKFPVIIRKGSSI
ncbi:MAG: glucose-1-phosphate adenylyltransferase subunit GlgD [Christensenellaceae bacterium]|jgi:glucose-1-phosphate adenylyltransferase|nr:glucose-1-phosphate adenylyltransferase subunit GlgD [Christensenellaceae bacterium]